MNRNQKIGVILIIVGIGLPLLALAFVDYYLPEGGFIYNMQHFMDIDIELNDTEIPYGYIFILGIILIGTGIGLIFLSKPKGDKT